MKKIYTSGNFIIVALNGAIRPYSKINSNYDELPSDSVPTKFLLENLITKGKKEILFVDADTWENNSTDAVNLTGTISVTNASDAIIGVGTKFLKELSIGDSIKIDGIDYVIDIITDDTNAILTIVYAGATDNTLTVQIYRTFYTEETLRTFLQTNTSFRNGELTSITTADIFNGGFIDYNDSGISQSVTVAGSPVILENDGAGAFTNKNFLPTGITELWDVINDTFDWSELKPGDIIDIRLDVLLTTLANNTEVKIDLHLGTGGESYIIPFITNINFKSIGTYQLNRFSGIYMGDANTLDNGGQFKISTDQDCSIVVIGWYIKIIQKG